MAGRSTGSSRRGIVEFDGASKGNPGKAGAGAVVRSENGTVVSNMWSRHYMLLFHVYRCYVSPVDLLSNCEIHVKVSRLCEGLGTATNNEAEYKGLILGMKGALNQGFKHIRIQGDSELVFKQVQGEWKVRAPHLADLCKEAKELTAQFDSCQFCPVGRAFNSDADREANRAVNLRGGEVYDSSASD